MFADFSSTKRFFTLFADSFSFQREGLSKILLSEIRSIEQYEGVTICFEADKENGKLEREVPLGGLLKAASSKSELIRCIESIRYFIKRRERYEINFNFMI